MSSENGYDSPNGDTSEYYGERVCRDFMRNICRRGKRCKYLHPNEKEQEGDVRELLVNEQPMDVCNDNPTTQDHLAFVVMLRDYQILLSKSKLPQVKAARQRAVIDFTEAYAEHFGGKLTPEQMFAKIDNLKTAVKHKFSLRETAFSPWEKMFLELLDNEIEPGTLYEGTSITETVVKNDGVASTSKTESRALPSRLKENSDKFEFIFCHDYQNGKCSRSSCRFVHCTREEEEFYRSTGELPSHVLESVVRKGIIPDVPRPGDTPVCKDYLKGECRRGGKCRFRHLSVREYEMELSYGSRNTPHTSLSTNGVTSLTRRRERFESESFPAVTGNNGVGMDRDLGPPEIKRRHYLGADIPQSSQVLVTRESHQQAPHGSHFYSATMLTHSDARTLLLDDENALLRKKIEELKKQVSDLMATNEFLLDQNAQLRMGGKRTANVTAVTVPAVTITNTGAPTMVQPLAAQIQPAQAPTPQQMVNAAVAAGTLRTVTASVATVPVSIAAVAGAPVSIATVSMAPVQIPPPVVTMAQQTLAVEGPQPPQQPGAPPQQGQQQNPQQGGPQSLPMSMSGATAPLVSYPIMTQDLRPVLQTSLSH